MTPHRRRPHPFFQTPSRYAQLYLKSPGPAPALQNVETIAAALDPQVQTSVETPGGTSLDTEVARLLAGPGFLMSLWTGFAVFTLLLTVLGSYGVAAFAAQQREQ